MLLQVKVFLTNQGEKRLSPMKTRSTRIYCPQVYLWGKLQGVFRQEGDMLTAVCICREHELCWGCSRSLSQCLFCCFNEILNKKQLRGDFRLQAFIAEKSRQEHEAAGHMTSTGRSREKWMHLSKVPNLLSLLLESTASTQGIVPPVDWEFPHQLDPDNPHRHAHRLTWPS